MDVATVVATVLASIGAAGLLTQIVRYIIKRADGSAAREREANTSLTSQRAKAIEERDQADAKLRILDAYAARANRKLIVHGHEDEVEPWPDLEQTIPKDQVRRLKSKPNSHPER